MYDLVHDGGNALAFKWTLAGNHLVEHHAHAEQIAATIEQFAQYLLGRHVVRRPDNLAGNGHRLAGARDSKIGNLHHAVSGQHDVSRFDIAMDDAFRVRKIQPPTDLPNDLDRLPRRDRPLAAQKSFER